MGPWLAARPRGRIGRAVAGLDERVMLALVVLLGILTWRAQMPGVVLYACLVGGALFFLGGLSAGAGKMARAYLAFALLWSVVKLALGLLESGALSAAAAEAAFFGLRLVVLLFLGLVLALSASPRRLGLAVAWYLRPVLRGRSWQVALGLSLMVHFLPIAFAAVSGVRQAMRLRCPALAWRKKCLLLAQAVLRVLSQKTWSQTLAVATRSLEGPAAWQPRFCLSMAELAAGLLVAAAAIFAASL